MAFGLLTVMSFPLNERVYLGLVSQDEELIAYKQREEFRIEEGERGVYSRENPNLLELTGTLCVGTLILFGALHVDCSNRRRRYILRKNREDGTGYFISEEREQLLQTKTFKRT